MQPLSNGIMALVALLRDHPEYQDGLVTGMMRVQLRPVRTWMQPRELKDGVLTVAVASAGWRREAEPFITRLYERINQTLGRQAVRGIEWVPLNSPAGQAMLDSSSGDENNRFVADAEIREAARRLDDPRAAQAFIDFALNSRKPMDA